jgi:hypothetical protein
MLAALPLVRSGFRLPHTPSSPFGSQHLERPHRLGTPLFKTVRTLRWGQYPPPQANPPENDDIELQNRANPSPGKAVEEKSPGTDFYSEGSEGRWKNQAGRHSSCFFDRQLDYTRNFSPHRSSPSAALIGGHPVNGNEVGYLGWSVSIGRSVLTPDAYFTSSTPRSILTRSWELVVHLAGRPKDPSFVRSLQSVEGQVSVIRTCTSEKWAKRPKRGRGPHTSVSIGLSYGGGSKVCF